MSLILNEEQRLLADTAREFLSARSPVTAQRRLRDEGVAEGFDAALWQDIAGLGWTGIPFGEESGGLAFGYQGLGPVFEEIGRNLSATPLLSSVVLAGSLLEQAGSKAQRDAWLPAIIAGEKRLALAVDEQVRHDPSAIALTAVAEGDGLRLDGEKVFVVDGVGADGWLVVAREGVGLSLFLVEAGTPGVTVVPTGLVDSRNHARLRLDGVKLPMSARIGAAEEAADVLDLALDRGRLCLAAELLGASAKLFELTVEYLKTRVQFDAPIGSFQALQHRAAWCHVHLELARSTVMAGFAALDDAQCGADERARLASLAKWKAGETAHRVGNEAVQMHGGIGVTDELDVGLYLKRIRVAQACLGDADFHCQRYAALTGEG